MENAHIMLEMAGKYSNYARNWGLCFSFWMMLFEADYAKNYASILYQCLVDACNRCFSILLSGCETGQCFRCYVVATPGRAEHKHSMHIRTECESNYDHVGCSPCEVFCLVFDLWFFWCWEDQDALSRPLFCFSLNNCKKKFKVKGKRGSFPDRASFRPEERRPRAR